MTDYAQYALTHQLISDLANAETGLRALGIRQGATRQPNPSGLAARLNLGYVVLTPAGRNFHAKRFTE